MESWRVAAFSGQEIEGFYCAWVCMREKLVCAISNLWNRKVKFTFTIIYSFKANYSNDIHLLIAAVIQLSANLCLHQRNKGF
jgi:hypothetical protein